MAECMMKRRIAEFDESEVTATPGAVRNGKTFLGAGTDDQQAGTIPDIPDVNHQMGINETYAIPAGIHSGEDSFSQNIPTKAGFSHTPTGQDETLNIAGNYMTGNVIIEKVTNYSPEYIKAGVTVGEGANAITGTFQGFVEDNI